MPDVQGSLRTIKVLWRESLGRELSVKELSQLQVFNVKMHGLHYDSVMFTAWLLQPTATGCSSPENRSGAVR
jgi:hypothetical protein